MCSTVDERKKRSTTSSLAYRASRLAGSAKPAPTKELVVLVVLDLVIATVCTRQPSSSVTLRSMRHRRSRERRWREWYCSSRAWVRLWSTSRSLRLQTEKAFSALRTFYLISEHCRQMVRSLSWAMSYHYTHSTLALPACWPWVLPRVSQPKRSRS